MANLTMKSTQYHVKTNNSCVFFTHIKCQPFHNEWRESGCEWELILKVELVVERVKGVVLGAAASSFFFSIYLTLDSIEMYQVHRIHTSSFSNLYFLFISEKYHLLCSSSGTTRLPIEQAHKDKFYRCLKNSIIIKLLIWQLKDYCTTN